MLKLAFRRIRPECEQDGPILVWAAELDDPEHAATTFAQSSHPIDREHALVLRECLDERPTVTRVFDLALSK